MKRRIRKKKLTLEIYHINQALVKNAEEDITQSWLSVGLTVIDLTLIILLFMRGI